MSNKVSHRDVQRMSDDELREESDGLAEQRTEVRLRQNEVNAELEIRQALKALPAEAQRVVRIRLEGGIAPVGDANAGEDD